MVRRIALLVLLVAAGCAHQRWVCDRLYFGQQLPGGGVVSEAEWGAFVEGVVTPRFPDGLTIYAADGQWRGTSGMVQREPVRVIEILHPGSAAADRALAEITTEYKKRFQQEAVLRVRSRARVQFAASGRAATPAQTAGLRACIAASVCLRRC